MLYPLFLSGFFLFYAIIAWRDFTLAIALLAAFLPAYLLRFSLGPLPSTALEGMILILAGIWLFQEYRSGHLKKNLTVISQSTFFWPGVLLLVSGGASILWATDQRAALGIYRAYFLEPFLVYGMVLTRIRSQQAWKKVFLGLGSLVMVLFCMALFQRVTGLYSPTWEWTLPESRRVTGPFTSPNALGLLVAPIVTLFLGWRFTNERWKKWLEVFSLVVIVLGASAILLAVSKGATIALIATAALVLFLAWSPKKTALIAGLGFLVLLTTPSIQERIVRLASFQEASGQSRLVLYKGAAQILMDHPLTGAGLASFADMFETVRPPEYYEELIYPHNVFLNFWSETGLLGLIAVLWILALCVRIAWKHRHQRNGLFYSWVFLLALAPMFIHGMVDVPYFKNDLAVFTWMLLAGLSWSARDTERTRLFSS